MTKSEEKKTRRNKHQIRLELLDSVGKALKTHGFANLGVNLISEYSKVDKNTIYRHYKDFQNLLTQYIEKQDFWLRLLNDSQHEQIKGDFRSLMKKIITDQYVTINRDRELQQLLIWELGELSPRTKSVAQRREALSASMIKQYKEIFYGSGIDINTITAIIIAGIYYLVLHKEHSTCCTVDFTREKERIPGAINQLVDMLFESLEQFNYKAEVARKAKSEGIDIVTISKITGIEASKVEEL